MGELLTRRALMMAGEPLNLIKFEDRNFTISSSATPRSYLEVSNGNHFVYYARNRGTNFQAYVSPVSTSVSVPSGWPEILALHTGDELTMKLKNVRVHSNQSASYNGYAQCSLRNLAGSYVFGWADSDSSSPLYIVGKQLKTYDELSKTTIMTEDVSIGMLRFYNYGTGQAMYITLNCNVEVYVNGARVI